MKSASESTLSLNDIKILRPKVTKNLTNLHKTFCESPSWIVPDLGCPGIRSSQTIPLARCLAQK